MSRLASCLGAARGDTRGLLGPYDDDADVDDDDDDYDYDDVDNMMSMMMIR